MLFAVNASTMKKKTSSVWLRAIYTLKYNNKSNGKAHLHNYCQLSIP